MRIGLVSEEILSGQVDRNLRQIRRLAMEYRKEVDLLCFGESFLHGYSSLQGHPEENVHQGTMVDDNLIKLVSVYAHKYKVALSFGYFEKENDILYSSVLFIGDDGTVVNNYRRQTSGLKGNDYYGSGTTLKPFTYKDTRFMTLICEDLRNNEILNQVIETEVDVILWPVYMERGTLFKEESLSCIKKLKADVLMVNAFDLLAQGGCAYFRNGQLIDSLEEGEKGVLIINR